MAGGNGNRGTDLVLQLAKQMEELRETVVQGFASVAERMDAVKGDFATRTTALALGLRSLANVMDVQERQFADHERRISALETTR